jgi:hypothetical protein
MRSLPSLLCVLLVAACGAAEQPPQAEPATSDAAMHDIADYAGTWENVVTLDGVDTPIPSTMSGTAAGTDWTMSLEGRPGIPLQVMIVGDSLISESAEYESILRPGVMVSVRTSSVLQDGVLVGNVVTDYRTAEGNQQVHGTLRGTRVQ